MTGAELQTAIFNYRLKMDDSVVFSELPTAKQLDILLGIDSERNYFGYNQDMAINDIQLYYQYLEEKNKWKKD